MNEGPYRVEVTGSQGGAWMSDKCLIFALMQAVSGSKTITPHALVVGVLAYSVSNQDLDPDAEKLARELIEEMGVPMNMMQLVELMDMP